MLITTSTRCFPIEAQATPYTNKTLFGTGMRPRLGTFTGIGATLISYTLIQGPACKVLRPKGR